MDGARLGCAVAALEADPAELLAGVDVLSFGGTKQGMLLGEAVVFLNPALGAQVPYWQKCACSWLPRCASWQPSSRPCWPETSGLPTAATPTTWPAGLKRP